MNNDETVQMVVNKGETVTLSNAAREVGVSYSYIRDAVGYMRLRSFKVDGIACCQMSDLIEWRKSVQDNKNGEVVELPVSLMNYTPPKTLTEVNPENYVMFVGVDGIVKQITKKRGAIKDTEDALKANPEKFGVWHLSSSKRVYDRTLIEAFVLDKFGEDTDDEQASNVRRWVFKKNLVTSSHAVELTGTSRQNINAAIKKGTLHKYDVDGILCVNLRDLKKWRESIKGNKKPINVEAVEKGTQVYIDSYISTSSIADLVREHGDDVVPVVNLTEAMKKTPKKFGAWELSPSKVVYKKDKVIAWILREVETSSQSLDNNKKAQSVFNLWDNWDGEGQPNITQIAKSAKVHLMTARRYLNRSGRLEMAGHLRLGDTPEMDDNTPDVEVANRGS